jgi:hypothetical protein
MSIALPLAELWGVEWLWWPQIVGLLIVIGLIVFWIMYRRRQM